MTMAFNEGGLSFVINYLIKEFRKVKPNSIFTISVACSLATIFFRLILFFHITNTSTALQPPHTPCLIMYYGVLSLIDFDYFYHLTNELFTHKPECIFRT